MYGLMLWVTVGDVNGTKWRVVTYKPSLVSTKAFHNWQMIGLVQLLRMVHIHHGGRPVPTEGSIKMEATCIRKVGHSSDCFQEPEAWYGTIQEKDVEKLASNVIDKTNDWGRWWFAVCQLALALSLIDDIVAERETEDCWRNETLRRVKADDTAEEAQQLLQFHREIAEAKLGERAELGLVSGVCSLEVSEHEIVAEFILRFLNHGVVAIWEQLFQFFRVAIIVWTLFRAGGDGGLYVRDVGVFVVDPGARNCGSSWKRHSIGRGDASRWWRSREGFSRVEMWSDEAHGSRNILYEVHVERKGQKKKGNAVDNAVPKLMADVSKMASCCPAWRLILTILRGWHSTVIKDVINRPASETGNESASKSNEVERLASAVDGQDSFCSAEWTATCAPIKVAACGLECYHIRDTNVEIQCADLDKCIKCVEAKQYIR